MLNARYEEREEEEEEEEEREEEEEEGGGGGGGGYRTCRVLSELMLQDLCLNFSENSWCRCNELEGLCSEINSKDKNIRGL